MFKSIFIPLAAVAVFASVSNAQHRDSKRSWTTRSDREYFGSTVQPRLGSWTDKTDAEYFDTDQNGVDGDPVVREVNLDSLENMPTAQLEGIAADAEQRISEWRELKRNTGSTAYNAAISNLELKLRVVQSILNQR